MKDKAAVFDKLRRVFQFYDMLQLRNKEEVRKKTIEK